MARTDTGSQGHLIIHGSPNVTLASKDKGSQGNVIIHGFFPEQDCDKQISTIHGFFPYTQDNDKNSQIFVGF